MKMLKVINSMERLVEVWSDKEIVVVVIDDFFMVIDAKTEFLSASPT